MRLTDIELQPVQGLLSIVRMPATELPGLVVKTHANPDTANLCMQMFYILLALGENEFALEMQARALQQRCLFRIAGAREPSIRLLALMAPGDMLDNTPFEFLIENTDIRLDLLFLMPGQAPPEIIPDHDVAIVAIGESDKNQPLLEQAGILLVSWPRPVLNQSQYVMRCARHNTYQLLNDISGLQIPMTQRLRRDQISGRQFPVTIRPVDTHGGSGLEKVDSKGDLDAYLENHFETEYYVSEFIDYRSEDGLYRKLRIVLIDGEPYICHLAISDNWMVHYHSADMQNSVQKRDDEAQLLQSFDHDFAVHHGVVLRAIAKRLALDYVVLDCGQTLDGRLLLFEADSRGWIHATDPVEIFPYKRTVMQKAFDAFRFMLLSRNEFRLKLTYR